MEQEKIVRFDSVKKGEKFRWHGVEYTKIDDLRARYPRDYVDEDGQNLHLKYSTHCFAEDEIVVLTQLDKPKSSLRTTFGQLVLGDKFEFADDLAHIPCTKTNNGYCTLHGGNTPFDDYQRAIVDLTEAKHYVGFDVVPEFTHQTTFGELAHGTEFVFKTEADKSGTKIKDNETEYYNKTDTWKSQYSIGHPSTPVWTKAVTEHHNCPPQCSETCQNPENCPQDQYTHNGCAEDLDKGMSFGELKVGTKFKFVTHKLPILDRVCVKTSCISWETTDGGTKYSSTTGDLTKVKFTKNGDSVDDCDSAGNDMKVKIAWKEEIKEVIKEDQMTMKTDNFWDRYEKFGNCANSMIAKACVARKEMVQAIVDDLQKQLTIAFASRRATSTNYCYQPSKISIVHNVELVKEACTKLSAGWMVAESHGIRLSGLHNEHYLISAWISHDEYDKTVNEKKEVERKLDEERHLNFLEAQRKVELRRQKWKKARRFVYKTISYIATAFGGAALSGYASHLCDLVLPLLY